MKIEIPDLVEVKMMNIVIETTERDLVDAPLPAEQSPIIIKEEPAAVKNKKTNKKPFKKSSNLQKKNTILNYFKKK